MMVSNKQKGNAAEKQFKAVLYAWGFNDEQIEQARAKITVVGPGRFISSQNDFFKLYDFILRTNFNTFYIQVKSTGPHASTAKKGIMEDIAKYGRDGDHYIIAQKVAYKGFIMRHINKDGENKKEFINFKGITIDK